MAYKVSIGKKAIPEWKEAYSWYAEISSKIGLKFHNAAIERVDEIANYPHRFGPIQKRRRYRRTKIKHFPYLIVFKVDEPNQKIFIISFFHEKRNPSTLLKRLRK